MKIAGSASGRKKAPSGARNAVADSPGLDAFLEKAGLAADDLSDKGRDAMAQMLSQVTRLRAELEKARARAAHLEKLAHEDALMPVANRRAFMRELSRLLALAQRHGTEASLVYIDLNGMKAINDRHGHNAGDAALLHVARVLIDNVRHADVVARLGGDEFGVLLVKTDQEMAEEKAAALAAAVEQNPFLWNGLPIRVSAAFGAHCFRGGQTVAETLEEADRAMYRNKQLTKARATAS